MSSLYRRFCCSVRHQWQEVLKTRDAPHAVAGGVAIGVVFGFTPFFGLKTVLAVGVAWLCGCSRVAAVAAVALHDVLIPFTPLLLLWEYKIGRWLLGVFGMELPEAAHVDVLHWRKLLDWHLLREGLKETLWPLFIGSLVVAAPVALVLYWATLLAIKRHQGSRQRRCEAPSSTPPA